MNGLHVFDFRWIWARKVDPHQLSLPDWPVQCWLPGPLPQDTENRQGRSPSTVQASIIPLSWPSVYHCLWYWYTTVYNTGIPLSKLHVYYWVNYCTSIVVLYCPSYQYTTVQTTSISLGLQVYHCLSYQYRVTRQKITYSRKGQLQYLLYTDFQLPTALTPVWEGVNITGT